MPAGISLPMITFSFNPRSLSTLPLIAASVKTRVVSWKDAADRKESVSRDALVIPSSTGLATAGSLPARIASLLAASYS
ncbi:hypothetical protein D3C79_959640 [compost metagenome]